MEAAWSNAALPYTGIFPRGADGLTDGSQSTPQPG